MARDDEFADFVAARYRALVRTGLGLTGDLGHAEDLPQSALIRTYLSWTGTALLALTYKGDLFALRP